MLHKDTRLVQQNFARYCRTGGKIQIPGVLPERIPYYRKMLSTVIDETLISAFPLANGLIDSKEWADAVENFFSLHDCSAYQVWKIADEFRQFLIVDKKELFQKYPVLHDLLLFEWTEMDLFNTPDTVPVPIKGSSKFFGCTYLMNTEIRILQLSFPIHLQKAASLSDADRGIYIVLALRNPESKFVEFIAISVFHAWLLEQIIQKQSIHTILHKSENIFNQKSTEIRIQLISFVNHFTNLLFIKST